MESADSAHLSLHGLLDAAEDAAPVQAVEAITRGICAALSCTNVALLIADASGRALVRLTHSATDRTGLPGGAGGGRMRHDARENALTIPYDDGATDRAMREQAVQVLPPGTWSHQVAPGEVWTLLAPVIERGEALGLLEVSLPAEPPPAVVLELARTAHALGYVLVASRRHTDVYEWGQRSTPFSLSAEIQRRLLPPAYTCEGGAFTLSAWLEPAATVGGDSFDYSVDRDVLHLSMTDAMGHGVASSLTATLCVSSLRNTRRHGHSLEEQAGATNDAMVEHAAAGGREDFCTGVVARVDLSTGVLGVVNAGHVAPYLVRDGRAGVVALPVDLPFGMLPGARYRRTDVALRPGDRLVLVTDGMLERNATALDMPSIIRGTRDLHPREATRALADEVLRATGYQLADDATVLVVDWHGGHGLGRDTTSGAPTD